MVINSITVKERNELISLGITTDNKLVFKKHIDSLCRTAEYKLHALTRIREYLTLDKAILLGNMVINSQFNYAPLIWMFCRKTLYHKIEKIHHRTLKVIYQPEESYVNLLLKSSSVSEHQRHLRFLITEIYKSTTQINPEFMWSYFLLTTTLVITSENDLFFISLARIQHITALIPFVLEDLRF